MKRGKSISINRIETQAQAGSSITNCVREAVVLAMEEETDVYMTHNSNVYKVNYSAIVCTITHETNKRREG